MFYCGERESVIYDMLTLNGPLGSVSSVFLLGFPLLFFLVSTKKNKHSLTNVLTIQQMGSYNEMFQS